MRLDIFLPFLRKPRKGTAPRADGLLLRAVRGVLPAALFSDLPTAKPGLIRKWLRRLGPTWHSAPARRMVQGACFLLFLWLFFYVCWPYSARPSRSYAGWIPAEFEAASGQATLVIEEPLADSPHVGDLLHVLDESVEGAQPPSVGPFRVTKVDRTELILYPAAQLSAEERDRLAFSPGPWSLDERPPGSWPSQYADNLAAKERLAAEIFLTLDPLVALSTAIAARNWVWSLVCAAGILLVCVVIPRGFCGYLCPLGTLIDLFDWSLGRRVVRFRAPDDGWWVHIKYYLLLGCLVAAATGVLLTGFVAAIPVITRGMLFLLGPLQTGAARGWHQMPPLGPGHWFSLAMFVGVLFLGFLQPRFWCKYVCPSGAVFSVFNVFRASERKVESSCIHCNKCVEICPFDAIKPDFTTRTSDCTLCQTCAGVCPTQAIKFVERWNRVELKLLDDPPTNETPLGRRGFLAAGVGLAAGTVGGLGAGLATKTFGANLDDPHALRPVRPPGSVPEQAFLQMCIRCGECFKACPNDVLHAQGFQQGLEGLWTPRVVADWAGCESSCNACGQVCPTGAIRALPLDEKKVARMGLAIVNHQTCLPFAQRGACQLCVDECAAAGYHAIEFTRVGTQGDAQGNPIEGTGFLAPVVLADKCVGCGLCQTRCYGINKAEKGLLSESAIVIEAGKGKEDRLMHGSYLALSEQRRQQRETQQKQLDSGYLPEFLKQ